MKITNRDQFKKWQGERMRMGRDMESVRGMPPEGATYSDGEPITQPVNIGWKDCATGEVFAFEFESPNRQ